MKKVFVFDLDGTIVINNEKINEQIVKRLELIHQNPQNKLIFATSRALRGIESVVPPNLADVPLILCNGAMAYSKKILTNSNFIIQEACDKIIEFLIENKIEFYGELGTALYIPQYVTDPFFTILRMEGKNECVFYNYGDVRSEIYKIAIVECVSDNILKILRKFENEIAIYKHSDGSVDLVAKYTSKWKMLNTILGDTSDYKIIAFGNDNNDIELLENANIGIAVCPKNEQVKNSSDKIITNFYPSSILKALDDID